VKVKRQLRQRDTVLGVVPTYIWGRGDRGCREKILECLY